MKPVPFDYLAPASLDEAVALLAAHGPRARLLAGGQSMVAALNFRALAPEALIDLNVVPGLGYVRRAPGGGLRIGAMTRNRELETDPLIAAHLPLMHAALPFLAHPAIRNRGTIGGSLAYADPAAELPAVTLACAARYRAVSAGGERWIEAGDFFVDAFRTALRDDEILVEIEIPAPPAPGGWGFAEVARRHGDRVLMGVAAVLGVERDGTVREARLACQNAARTPFLARETARWLAGRRLDEETFAGAAATLRAEVSPPGEVQASPEYQRHLAGELVVRVLRQVRERAA